MFDDPRRAAAVLALALAAAGLLLSPDQPVPADAPDLPLALDVGYSGDTYLAMRADLASAGGIARTSDDCIEIARWRTGSVADLALDEGFGPPEVWALTNAHVARYSVTGEPLGQWLAPLPTARRIATIRQSETTTIYLLHAGDGARPARVSAHAADGTQIKTWDLSGEPRDLAALLDRNYQHAIYVVSARAAGAGGTLLRYSPDGVKHLELDLDLTPRAVGIYTGDVWVYAQPGGAADAEGQVLQFTDEGRLMRTWPTAGLVPIDIAGGGDIRVLGHAPGDPARVSLRRYAADGTPGGTCSEFPQPSIATPTPGAACPLPTPGAVLWRADGSGEIVSAPAIAADGTVYFGTLDGLMYAVDCAGRRKWVFDYEEHGPDFGPQAFHGSAALDDEGTIYIGDDVIVPNYFFAIRPDGSVKWVQRFEHTWSQIDTSPALARDGRIFAASHGWGAGVDFGVILVMNRTGELLRADAWSTPTGPITASPAILADGSAVFAAPPYDDWVLPTGTPPTATSTATVFRTPTPTPDLRATGTALAATLTAIAFTPTATRSATASPTATVELRHQAYLPSAQVERSAAAIVTAAESAAARATPAAASGHPSADQPLPPPWVTQPVPARLHQVHGHGRATPDTVIDLDGFDDPSSLAAHGQVAWLTATMAEGARLLAYDLAGTPRRVLEYPISARVAASPILGRVDPAGGTTEVFLMGTDGRLVALDVDLSDGSVHERWARFVGEPAKGAPALGDDGRVYVAAGRMVQALDRATGAPAWTVELDAFTGGSINLAPGGVLYVPTQRGTVYAIGTAAGGLDPDAAWPAYRRDARNVGSAEGRP